jgi:hypothetical protein
MGFFLLWRSGCPGDTPVCLSYTGWITDDSLSSSQALTANVTVPATAAAIDFPAVPQGDASTPARVVTVRVVACNAVTTLCSDVATTAVTIHFTGPRHSESAASATDLLTFNSTSSTLQLSTSAFVDASGVFMLLQRRRLLGCLLHRTFSLMHTKFSAFCSYFCV